MKFEEIKAIAVIGAGTMGPGLAQVFAQHHYQVRLCDQSEQSLEKARSVTRANLETMVEHDLLEAPEIETVEGHISFTDSLEDAATRAELVVECIAEERESKRKLFEQLDEMCPKNTIFASNTSYLNIFELLAEARLPVTVIAHWFAPPHILPLVEVVRGPESSDNTVNVVLELLRKVGKTPVVMEKFVPGFAINRILRILGREIFFLLDNGYITAEQLDLAVKASIAPRMMLLGLVQRYDFTGLDLSAKNLQNKAFIEAPLDKEPKSLLRLVEQGDLGVKTGKGFYDYQSKELEEILHERDSSLLEILKRVEFCLKEPVGKKKS
ncbi:MAG: 3-hydroxyacyl-CoA dehydrogenase family protein [Desulfatiglandales bacterium]|jgi:3-hydroxybutyryl-CoA dehydrogenase|nr:3-hydroxyacyl-CoA dehydrogenase family protein [Desulfatiglandales bacterium]